VKDQLAAASQSRDQCAEPQIVAERAQGIEHSAPQPPVADHHLRGGKQSIVAVHNAFRFARRARRKRQVHHLVGVRGRFYFQRGAGQLTERCGIGRADAPGATEEIAVGQFSKDVVAVGIAAVAC
jgi:hypothetical protein